MLEIKNVTSGYGDNKVLQNLSVCFKKGELTSVIGPNGSGKSTLLKTVIGIIKANSGDIFVENKSISSLNQKQIARRIAYLAQGKNTPDMTVEQMVLHGRFPHLSYPRRYSEIDRDKAYFAMEQTGISHLRDSKISSLSGGMRQNAHISMALAQDTDYILMDEPTTYLDISHQLELINILKNLTIDGKGVVTVMHDLPLAFTFSDKIAVINNGEILMHDTPLSVCNSGVLKDVFGIELQIVNDKCFYYNNCYNL